MRYLAGLVCVLVLGVMGCSETDGTGGSAGDGGSGGVGGQGGVGGVGGGTVACIDNVCPCTEVGIRAAIQAGGVETYTFDCDGPQTVTTESAINIDNAVYLDGGGNLTVDASRVETAFQVAQGIEAGIEGFTVTNTGRDVGCEYECAGVINGGTLRLTDVTVRASQHSGWGILNVGDLLMRNSTVSENTVVGIENIGEATLWNCTVSGNDIVNRGIMTLNFCTLSESAVGNSEEGTLTMAATLVDSDCSGSVTSGGYNLESSGNTCGFDQTGDQVNVSAEQLSLGPLADNGGPTMTHALLTEPVTSVAIDKVPLGDLCGIEGIDIDQRGEFRGDGLCDVGAFEVQP